MKRLILLLSVLMIYAPPILSETIALNRETVVQVALEQNETFQAAKLEKDRIKGQYIEARAGAFPRLTFDAGYQRAIDKQVNVITMTDDSGNSTRFQLAFGTPHAYQFGLTLTQPLYVGGKVGTAIKIAKHGFIYTDAVIDAARNDIATAADKAYLDAIAARQAEMAFSEAERLADSNLAVVRKLHEQGQVSEFDLLRAQVQAANTRPGRIAAANQAQLALDYLKNLLAIPPETSIRCDTAVGEVVVGELSLEPLISEALRQRPELRSSSQMVEIRKDLISIAKGGYKPTIGITSTVGWQSLVDRFKLTSVRDENWNRSWTVGIGLSWPIFSGFETIGKIRQAKVDYEQSRLTDVELTRRIRLEVQDAHGKVREAGQRLQALGETVTQANRGVEIAQVRYKSGVGTQLELLDAQVALTTARVNRISAEHDLAVAVSALRRAVGRQWAPKW